MSSFDSVHVACPRCADPVEFQSKSGECAMQDFTLATAPLAVLADLENTDVTCAACGLNFELVRTPSLTALPVLNP